MRAFHNRYPTTAATLLAALLFTGCTQTAKSTAAISILKIQIRFPQGTILERVDFAAARLMLTLQSVPGAQRVQTVARDGEFEAYVQTTASPAPDAVRTLLNERPIPDTAPPEISTLAGPMPDVTPQSRPALNVNIDREKAAALGVNVRDITDAVTAFQSKESSPEAIEAISLKTASGEQVPLSAVAQIRIESRPDCIVRKWP